MHTTYVFGHKVPDTDSVCASISMAYLQNALNIKTEPRVLGELNKETKFALDYFGFPEPKFLNDVKVKIKDMQYSKNIMIEEHVSIGEAYNLMSKQEVTGFPLVDKNKKLNGYINVKEIAKYLIEGDVTELDTSYDNILSTLNAFEVLRFDNEIKGVIIAAAYKSETFLNRITLREDNILIVGDRYRIQEYAIKSKIKLLLLVNNVMLPDDLLEIAKRNKVNVIRIPMGTFRTSNRIKLCNYVRKVNINSKPITFDISDYRDDFLEISSKYGHTNYPIVDKKGTCLGMLRLVDANKYHRREVILVDHNQRSQTVDGIDEADVLEVIDHHNLGTIGTNYPINVRCMPVGCTCTIIYRLFRENKIDIPKDIAGIMLSAILSDTLIFKSPTTTDLDIDVANKLAKIAEVDVEEYGYAMFKAGSSIAGMSMEDIINGDIKSFKLGDSSMSISQINTMDIDELLSKKTDIVSSLNTMCNIGNYKVSLFFVTDIIKKGSYLFYNEGSSEILKDAYGLNEIKQGIYLDGMVSRKKQLLPPLLDLYERR